MMIPGIMAQRRHVPPVPVDRPVFRSSSNAQASSGGLSVPLPIGWKPGDLGILQVGVTSATLLTIAGWTLLASRGTAGGSMQTFYRVLQSGDGAVVVPNVGKRAAILLAFEGGTFNSEDPVSVPLGTLANGTGTSVTSPASSDPIPAAGYYHIQVAVVIQQTFYSDTTTYPYEPMQLSRTTAGTYPLPLVYVAGEPFDGGAADPSSTFTRPVSEAWATYKLLVNPPPAAP